MDAQAVLCLCFSYATIRPRGYKTFFMLNSTEHDFYLLIETKMLKIKTLIAFKLSNAVFIMLINVKMLTTVDILTLMSIINSVNCWHLILMCIINSINCWHFNTYAHYEFVLS